MIDFSARVVNINNNTGNNISLVGIIAFLVSIVIWTIPSSDAFALPVSIIGIVLVLVGAFSNKGSGLYKIGEDLLTLSDSGITLGGHLYQYSNLRQLQFYYDSFYSQSSYGYFTESSGMIEYGLNNKISFIADGKELNQFFYLSDINQANAFFSTLAALKSSGINYSLSFRGSNSLLAPF